PAGAELLGQDVGELLNRALGGVVDRISRPHQRGGGAGDRDDPAPVGQVLPGSCRPWNTPLTLTAKLRSNSASVSCAVATAALLTSMSHRPNSASISSTMARYSARLLMSAATVIAVPSAARMPAATFCAGSGVCGWLMTTRAPAAANSVVAIALPIPVA